MTAPGLQATAETRRDGGAFSVAATDGWNGSSVEADLDGVAQLSRSLLARARRLDDLWSQHGLEVMGFRCALAEHFETVERAVEDLVRHRALAGHGVPPAQDHRTDSRSTSWREQ